MTRLPAKSAIRAHRAFSLVELVIVMVIVGILAAIAVPRFAAANARHSLDAAADRLVTDMIQARERAIHASRRVSLTFDVENNAYHFNAVGGWGSKVVLDAPPYDVRIESVDFDGAKATSFNGFGYPASPGRVVLKSEAGAIEVKLDENGMAYR